MFTKAFLQDSLERALKTFAQSLLSLFVVGDSVFNLFSVDLKQALGVAAGAVVLSFLTSIISANVGSTNSASLVD